MCDVAEDYTVQQGDCILSITHERGFHWETIWNHSSNSALKTLRKNPNVLMEGDVVHIPDLRLKQESGGTEQKHKFKLKGVPGKFILVLTRPDSDDKQTEEGTDPDSEPTGESSDPEAPAPKAQKPWASVAWKCIIDGAVSTGTTGSDGKIELTIKPSAQEAQLVLEPDKPTQRVLILRLGNLDPADSPRGAVQRLRGLGFDPGPWNTPPAEDDPQFRDAVQTFQATYSLPCTSKLDKPTMDKLKEVHGS